MLATDPTIVFFDNFVLPAIADYHDAEDALVRVSNGGSGDEVKRANLLVMRRARTAAIELHQFGDRVLAERPSWAPAVDLRQLRLWLRDNHARTFAGARAEDVDVLHDIADAFKHAQLTRSAIYVGNDQAVVTMATGWGDLGWGEAKWGGVEQVIVTLADGRKKALSFVLRVVQTAWGSAMGRPVAW